MHVNVARSYDNLALVYQKLGDFEQAREYQKRALDIKLDKLGPVHVNVARSYDNLALIYEDLGDFEETKKYKQRALAIRADKHGLNKTPNKVRTANRRKAMLSEIIFLLERFYAVLKGYRVGPLLKSKRLNFSGFFSQQHKLCLKLQGSSMYSFLRSSNL